MSEPTKCDVGILGGGISGLYAAVKLARAGKSVTVLEEAAEPGGLSRGIEFEGNSYDLGVQTLRFDDSEFAAEAEAFFGDELIDVSGPEFLRIGERDLKLPLQHGDWLKGLSFGSKIGGLSQAITKKWSKKPPKDAAEALKRLYGGNVYRDLLKDYVEQVWGLPPEELSPSFATEVLAKVSAATLMDEEGSEDDSKPKLRASKIGKNGGQTLIEKLVAELQEAGGQIVTQAQVSEIVTDGNKIAGVRCKDLGSELENPASETLACDAVISTIPIRSLVKAFHTQAPAQIHASSLHLRYRAAVFIGCLVRKDTCLPGFGVEFRGKTFHRLSEPRLAGSRPDGHTVLLIEMATDENSAIWHGDERVWATILDELEAENICKRDEIAERHQMGALNAYPVPKKEFEEHHDKLFAYFSRYSNLHCAGQLATFSYPGLVGAMEQGATAAKRVLE